MILSRLEFWLMNNPIRAAMQRHIEARIFLRMGGLCGTQGCYRSAVAAGSEPK